jgi:hypothetical protein
LLVATDRLTVKPAGPDASETATEELALWFGPEEMLEYERDVDRWAIGRQE